MWQSLAKRRQKQWSRPPTGEELHGLIADFVRDEVLYREALARGLHRSDLVVRCRLLQKMEMLALEDNSEPDDAELMEYFLKHRTDYRLPETISFRHVFYNAVRSGTDALTIARAVRDELNGTGPSNATGIGDRSPMPSTIIKSTQREVEGRFGAEFATAVFDVDPGTWSGPIASEYGQHLVFVTARAEGRLPDFPEVSRRVSVDLSAERRLAALDQLYAQVSDNYQVIIEQTPSVSAVREAE
jgi:hypothetical protein